MNTQELQQWQQLHGRKMAGEPLSASEQADYETGQSELDSTETLDGDIERLRELRNKIAAAEVEQQRLREQHAALDACIAALEACLDSHTRHLLQIGS